MSTRLIGFQSARNETASRLPAHINDYNKGCIRGNPGKYNSAQSPTTNLAAVPL
jgi:hypothetical protein